MAAATDPTVHIPEDTDSESRDEEEGEDRSSFVISIESDDEQQEEKTLEERSSPTR